MAGGCSAVTPDSVHPADVEVIPKPIVARPGVGSGRGVLGTGWPVTRHDQQRAGRGGTTGAQLAGHTSHDSARPDTMIGQERASRRYCTNSAAAGPASVRGTSPRVQFVERRPQAARATTTAELC